MSDVFDFDLEGQAAQDEQARLNPLDTSQVRDTWDGAGEAFKRLLRPSAAAGRSILTAGAVPLILQDKAVGLVTGSDAMPATDRYFRDVVDGLGTDAVDAWTPDATEMGAASKGIAVASEVIGSIPQIIGTPQLFLGTSMFDPATEQVRQGVDARTALGVGAVNLGANALGLRLPAAFGSSLATRVATGAGANLAVGTAADAGSAGVLDLGGYDEQAGAFDPADPYARGLDFLLGAAFGMRANVDAPAMAPAERDAVLTARNADHFRRGTLPGEPATADAPALHQDALAGAIKQVLAGEQVDVASVLRADDFMLPEGMRAPAPRPEPPVSTAPLGDDLGGYEAYRRALESGGTRNPNTARPVAKDGRLLSSALGADQFTTATWKRIVASANPAWAEGLSERELLALRADPQKSAEMAKALDAENAARLRAAGMPVTRHTLYAAHHFGGGKGVAFARAPIDKPMAEILTPAQLEANPYLRNLTKGEAIANWDRRARRAGAEVRSEPVREPAPEEFAASVGRQLELDEAGTPTFRDGTAYDAARIGEFYDRVVGPTAPKDGARMPDVLFRVGRADDFTADGLDAYLPGFGENLREIRVSARTIKHVHDSRPEIAREVLEDMRSGALQVTEVLPNPDREGRALLVLEQRPDARNPRTRGVQVVEVAANGRGVDIVTAMTAPERSLGKARAKAIELSGGTGGAPRRAARKGDVARPEGQQIGKTPNFPHPHRPPKGPHAAADFPTVGRVTPGAKDTDGSGKPGEPAVGAETPLDAAARLASENPDLQIPDGFDADGNPVYRRLGDVLADIQADQQRAQQDAQAFPAAVSCYLRRGDDAP